MLTFPRQNFGDKRIMEVERRMIWSYTDLQEFFIEVCGDHPTEDRDDVMLNGGYPFLCIISQDSDGEFTSFEVYPDEFVGELDG